MRSITLALVLSLALAPAVLAASAGGGKAGCSHVGGGPHHIGGGFIHHIPKPGFSHGGTGSGGCPTFHTASHHVTMVGKRG